MAQLPWQFYPLALAHNYWPVFGGVAVISLMGGLRAKSPAAKTALVGIAVASGALCGWALYERYGRTGEEHPYDTEYIRRKSEAAARRFEETGQLQPFE